MASAAVRNASGSWVPHSVRHEMAVTFSLWRCVVLDVALVALTILVFAVLALVLKGLERL